jgi:hypothetical protein
VDTRGGEDVRGPESDETSSPVRSADGGEKSRERRDGTAAMGTPAQTPADFRIVVACPACRQTGTHHIGQQFTRPDSEDHYEIMFGLGEVLRSGPVMAGGTFRQRDCLFCGHEWNQREEA